MQRGALLIHGFTATPDCLESLAAPLRQAGFEVVAPLLKGHGLTPADLAETSWQDWYGGVFEEFQKLQKRCETVSVAGLSLGGLLGLMLASELPVHRLALLATPVFLSGFMAKFVLPMVGNTVLKEVFKYQPKWAGPAIADPEARGKFKSYSKMPIKSIMEIVRFQKEVAPRIPFVTAPTLIIHSPHDTTAPYENMAYLKEHLGSSVIQTVTLERSNHVLTMDYEKDLVAQDVIRFFGENL
jgi:carboxylesterase